MISLIDEGNYKIYSSKASEVLLKIILEKSISLSQLASHLKSTLITYVNSRMIYDYSHTTKYLIPVLHQKFYLARVITVMNSILKISVLLLFAMSACKAKKENDQTNETRTIGYNVQRSLPHDPKAFTQGLTIHQGELYESTGQNGSWIGVVDIKTGIAKRKITLSNDYFGEGITILNNKVYQLTWQDSIGFVYDLESFKKIKNFAYQTEGWGITHDNKELIMSDGSNQLYFLDSIKLTVTKKLKVTYNGKPVDNLNELEYAEGFIYANVWQTNLIAKINPDSGEVLGFLDLSKLAAQAQLVNPSMDVLNGIAWHESTKSLLVTGKYWPFIYILKLETPKDNV